MPGWILAVDFGTVNTGATVRFADGRVEKVKLEAAADTMASAVVLVDGRWRVGQAALNARWTHPAQFVGSPKARLGQEPMLLGDALVDPAVLASQVLSVVRDRAVRAAGGGAPDRLVLTHPVDWGRKRLDALREAARLAGFPTDSIRLLPEPIAALHAHVQPGSLPPGSRVMVVDTGGGTCDVALLQVTDDPTPGNDLLVVAQEGDDRLGGNDLDELLYRWVLAQLDMSGRSDIVAALAVADNLAAALTLRDMVRAAKQDLSEHANAPIAVDVNGARVSLNITREEYEGIIAEPMSRAGALASRVLATSGTTNLAALYLTGGTAYTPALSRVLHQATSILATPMADPKLAVALGALKTPTAVLDPEGLFHLTQQLRAVRTPPPGGPAPAVTDAPTQQMVPGGPGPAPLQAGTPAQPPFVRPDAPAGPPAGAWSVPQQPTGPNQVPVGTEGRKKPTAKILAGVLGGLLVVGAVVGAVLWFGSSDKPDPLAATGGPGSQSGDCWRGSADACPEFAGRQAVQYAFAPFNPSTCSFSAMNMRLGLAWEDSCSDGAIRLYLDVSSATAFGENKVGTWENGDGDTVGTVFSPYNDKQRLYCYDKIPLCLMLYGNSAVRDFGTLSTSQIQRVETWLSDHPVADPTTDWDLKSAQAAFPAAAGTAPPTCSVAGDPNSDVFDGSGEIFECEWPDINDVYISRWSSAQDAAQAFRTGGVDTEEPWMVNGVERGIRFDTGSLAPGIAWCYADLPYCMEVWSDSDAGAIDRIAPLTAEQAAGFFADVEAAEQAFPAAAGFKPLTCKNMSTDLVPTSSATGTFTCRWPTDGQHKVIVTQWPSAQDGPAAWRAYLARDSVSQTVDQEKPWTVDDVVRGTTFATDEAQVWCYADAPYCIETRDTSSGDVVWKRLAVLTEDQAAALGKP
ncbi:MAG: Hsp70 family protein [Micrococcales bacterium]|nr:Hsp70 family protein [Micrococcales bacterium]